MSKEIAPSRQVAIKTFATVFKYLIESGGTLRRKDVIGKLKSDVHFTDWELELYPNSNTPRWEKIFAFYTIPLVKAGFLQKVKRVWTITPEGEAAFRKGPETMIDLSMQGYKDWNLLRDKEGIANSKDTIVEQIKENDITELTIEEYEEKAIDGIMSFLKSKNAYEFQDLVAALLRAMNYHTPFISPKGKDGGIDIIAYQDPLGVKTPRIKVQVKHYPENPIPADSIRSLKGLINSGEEVGLFVTSGRFSNEAERFAREANVHIKLINGEDFISLWQEFYNKMPDEDKSLLPLQSIYFLGSNE